LCGFFSKIKNSKKEYQKVLKKKGAEKRQRERDG
jgi:hypothetical protein